MSKLTRILQLIVLPIACWVKRVCNTLRVHVVFHHINLNINKYKKILFMKRISVFFIHRSDNSVSKMDRPNFQAAVIITNSMVFDIIYDVADVNPLHPNQSN